MNRRGMRRLDEARRQGSAAEAHVIDELLNGGLGRREFMQRATLLGMSVPLASGLLAACGGTSSGSASTSGGSTTSGGSSVSSGSSTSGGSSAAAGKQGMGGTLRNAVNTPTAAIDPTKVADNGGLVTMSQVGEYLAYTDSSPVLRPVLATKWTPDATGRVWTFDIRQGVKFHNGKPLTAADVAATFERLADPANGSNALSVFTGVLGKGGTKAKGTQVVFTLEKPTVNFPYLVSAQNYNAITLPADYDPSKFSKDMMGTGPFKFDSYSAGRSARFVKNPDYWDTSRQPFLDAVELTYYSDLQPQILALQGGQVDVVSGISYSSGRGLFTNPDFISLSVPSSYTRQLSMRCDQKPFNDPRVRMALALALNRVSALQSLIDNKGVLGNDSPFAPSQPDTDKSVPQRKQDIAKAKALLAAAGHPSGFSATLTAPREVEIPDLAVTMQNAAREIGVTLKLNIMAPNDYYGDATFGKSPWLDSTMSLVDYGHRSVPDVIANAALRSNGVWNAAHYKNAAYDKLFDTYSAELDVPKQKKAVSDMQKLLLTDTPIIDPYFLNWLGATRKGVQGVNLNPTGQLDVSRASVK